MDIDVLGKWVMSVIAIAIIGVLPFMRGYGKGVDIMRIVVLVLCLAGIVEQWWGDL